MPSPKLAAAATPTPSTAPHLTSTLDAAHADVDNAEPTSSADAVPQDEAELDPSLELMVRRAEAKMATWEGPSSAPEGWMEPVKGVSIALCPTELVVA